MKTTKTIDACYEVWQSHYEGNGVAHFKKKKSASKTAKKAAKKEKRADRRENFKAKVAGAVEKLGQIGVLLPFKKMMREALKAKGINTTDQTDLAEIASLFYDNIVRKKSNYSVGNFALSAAAIGGIISGILSFIKGLKRKKDEGATLTQAEEKILTNAEKVDAAAEEMEKDYTEESIGELLMKYWWVLLIPFALKLLK